MFLFVEKSPLNIVMEMCNVLTIQCSEENKIQNACLSRREIFCVVFFCTTLQVLRRTSLA